MRRVLVVTAIMAAGLALVSCTAPQSSGVDSAATASMADGPRAPVVRAPLAPPVGYASPPSNAPTPLAPYANSPNDGAEPQTAHWRASPHWAAIKGEGCIVVEQDPQAKLEDQPESGNTKVENCSREDAGDATSTQPEESSGY